MIARHSWILLLVLITVACSAPTAREDLPPHRSTPDLSVQSALDQMFRLRKIQKPINAGDRIYFLVQQSSGGRSGSDLWQLDLRGAVTPSRLVEDVSNYDVQADSMLLISGESKLQLFNSRSGQRQEVSMGGLQPRQARLLAGDRILFIAKGGEDLVKGGDDLAKGAGDFTKQGLYLFSPGDQSVRKISAARELPMIFFVNPAGNAVLYQTLERAGDYLQDYVLHFVNLATMERLPVTGIHYLEEVFWSKDGAILAGGSPDVRRDVVLLYRCEIAKRSFHCRRQFGSMEASLPGSTAGFLLGSQFVFPDDRISTTLYTLDLTKVSQGALPLASLPGTVVFHGDNGVTGDPRSRQLFFIYQDQNRGPDLFAYRLATRELKQLSHFNDDLHLHHCPSSTVKVPSFDGHVVDGVLISPCRQSSSKRYPLIINLHGGPLGAVRVGRQIQQYQQVYAQQGYFIFSPNYRGSYIGQSSRLLYRRAGVDDLEDVRRSIARLKEMLPLSGRVGIIGHSYGGHLASLLAYQPQISAVVVKNSFYDYPGQIKGTLAIRAMNTEYFQYTTPAEIDQLHTISPLSFTKPPLAPMLLIHGEQDMLPVAEVKAYHRRLRDLGSRVTMKIYPDEGHSISQPKHIQDMLMTTLAFFDDHLKSASSP